MLDAYIIEELKRREEKKRQKERQRPCIKLPVEEEEYPDPVTDDHHSGRDDRDRGVVIIDFSK
jgi:hypothetical protein